MVILLSDDGCMAWRGRCACKHIVKRTSRSRRTPFGAARFAVHRQKHLRATCAMKKSTIRRYGENRRRKKIIREKLHIHFDEGQNRVKLITPRHEKKPYVPDDFHGRPQGLKHRVASSTMHFRRLRTTYRRPQGLKHRVASSTVHFRRQQTTYRHPPSVTALGR